MKDKIVVKTQRGTELGTIVAIEMVSNISSPTQLEGLILRKAEKEDISKLDEIKKEEQEIFKVAKQKISKHGLLIKLIQVEYMFDMKKVVFYFSANERIDFRNLLRDFVDTFKVWVELRQVSTREGARILGGAGICGKNLCCASFLNEFKNVHIQSIIDQGILVNSSKLCGVCGRLMCCLKYEEDLYLENSENLPKIDEIVRTPKGNGIVIGHNILSGRVKIALLENSESLPLYFELKEIDRILS
ncbi:MAG: stage 0 sporulation protein [Oscillospiraceae bacterium]|nr:stage 0 sporulation protein [Oscillospiraceae bacterium]